MTTTPLGVHVMDVLYRLNPQLRLNGSTLRPGAFADATLFALVEREADQIYDLPERSPYLTLSSPPPVTTHPLVQPLARRHWRDWLLRDAPVPGTWRGLVWCLRQCRRDVAAASLIATTMEWSRGNKVVVYNDWLAAKRLWEWRPLAVDVIIFGMIVPAIAILVVAG